MQAFRYRCVLNSKRRPGMPKMKGHSAGRVSRLSRHLAIGRVMRYSRDLVIGLKKAEQALKKARKLAPKSRFSRDLWFFLSSRFSYAFSYGRQLSDLYAIEGLR